MNKIYSQDCNLKSCSRIIWQDSLRGFAIFLVVFGHFIMRLNCGGYLLVLIYSFHMPLFFFLSGYNLKELDHNLTVLKIRSLMGPYLIFCGLFFVYQFMENIFVGNLSEWLIEVFTQKNMVHTVIMSNKSYFSNYWFLPTLSTSYIFFFIFRKKIHTLYNLFLITLLAASIYVFVIQLNPISLPLGIGEAILSLPFICFAKILKNNEQNTYYKLELICSIIIFCCSQIYTKLYNIPMANMYNSQINSLMLFWCTSFSSCFIFWYFFSRSKISNIFYPISILGQYSLWIYGLHYMIMEIILQLHNMYLLVMNKYILLLLSFFYSCVTILLCILVFNIFSNYKVKPKYK